MGERVMLRNPDNLQRIMDIRNGAKVEAKDIAMFEYEYEEMLIDSEWYENSFTLIGYLCAHPRWSKYKDNMYSKFTARTNINYVHVTHYAFEDFESDTKLYDGITHDQPLACAFYADVINDIPEYRERFCDLLKGLLHED